MCVTTGSYSGKNQEHSLKNRGVILLLLLLFILLRWLLLLLLLLCALITP